MIPSVNKLGGCLLAAIVLCGAMANAAILRQYDFSSGTGASFSDPNTTTGSFTSTGITPQIPTVIGGEYVIENKPLDTAFNAAKYLSFTIQANNPYKLTLTSLTFDGRVIGSLTASWAVRSSVDGFVNNLGTGSFSSSTLVQQSTTFPTLGFTNTSASIEFRVYVWVTDNANSKQVVFDNVTLNGSVVPEPSTIAASIFGIGFLAMSGIRIIRRRCDDAAKA